jgi:hypothetical protein
MTEAKSEAAEPIIGRFADPTATATVDLGPCRCRHTPHERDSAQRRTSIGDGEAKAVWAAGWQSTNLEYMDWEAANDAAIARFITSWTLLDEKGDPVPITRQTASLLDEPTRQALLVGLNEGRFGGAALPNGSGAPSRASSRGSASRTRTTRTRH